MIKNLFEIFCNTLQRLPHYINDSKDRMTRITSFENHGSNYSCHPKGVLI